MHSGGGRRARTRIPRGVPLLQQWRGGRGGQDGGAGRRAGGRCWQRARRWRAGLCREASQRGRAAPPSRPASRRPRSVWHTRGSAGARTGAPAFLRPAWVLSCLQPRLWEAATAGASTGRRLPAPRREPRVCAALAPDQPRTGKLTFCPIQVFAKYLLNK